jgi:hypothetical protein
LLDAIHRIWRADARGFKNRWHDVDDMVELRADATCGQILTLNAGLRVQDVECVSGLRVR